MHTIEEQNEHQAQIKAIIQKAMTEASEYRRELTEDFGWSVERVERAIVGLPDYLGSIARFAQISIQDDFEARIAKALEKEKLTA